MICDRPGKQFIKGLFLSRKSLPSCFNPDSMGGEGYPDRVGSFFMTDNFCGINTLEPFLTIL